MVLRPNELLLQQIKRIKTQNVCNLFLAMVIILHGEKLHRLIYSTLQANQNYKANRRRNEIFTG